MSGLHATLSDTDPDKTGSGGIWAVSCWCGWEHVGEYRGLLLDEPRALRYAHSLGNKHESQHNPKRMSA